MWWSDFMPLAHGGASPCDGAAVAWFRESFALEYDQVREPGVRYQAWGTKIKAAIAKAKKSVRAEAALAKAKGQDQARRGLMIYQAGGMAVRNIAILTQASGRQMVHTLWRMNERRAGQSELQATFVAWKHHVGS
eukprot:2815360-Alexandrium_andersonii.AAC.1